MKLLTIIALFLGYRAGQKAGEQRYRQILWVGRMIRDSQAFKNLMHKVTEAVANVAESITGERPEWIEELGGSQTRKS